MNCLLTQYTNILLFEPLIIWLIFDTTIHSLSAQLIAEYFRNLHNLLPNASEMLFLENVYAS